MHLTKSPWGTVDGHDIYLFKLQNERMEVVVSNYGATITAINIKGKNIVLGYHSLQQYIDDTFYIGCTVGRFAGRIANASLPVNETLYTLSKNDGSNHLHGGTKGFGKQAFSVVDETLTEDIASVKFFYKSKHLEEGYPGNLDVFITFELSADNALTIKYKAVSDMDTHINLTNHSYFNLNDHRHNILDDQLFIDADNYVVTDKNYIPTGSIEPVENSAYSFKTFRTINEYFKAGYNECYVLNHNPGIPNAILSDANSGHSIIFETDMPGLVLYTGDYLSGPFLKNNGVCLETQYFPNAPNHPAFPGTLLNSGEQWNRFTRMKFSWK